MVNSFHVAFTGWQLFSTVGIFALVLVGMIEWNNRQPDPYRLPGRLMLVFTAMITAVLCLALYVATS